MKNINGNWVDDSGNMWDSGMFTELQAEAMSVTMVMCSGCKNSCNLYRCSGCTDCRFCENTENSENCRFSSRLISCIGCAYCTRCINCEFCYNSCGLKNKNQVKNY